MKLFVLIDILIHVHYLVIDLFRCWMIIEPPGIIVLYLYFYVFYSRNMKPVQTFIVSDGLCEFM